MLERFLAAPGSLLAVCLLASPVAGCGDKADDTGSSAGPVPDITGRYQANVTAATGCDGNSDLVDSWAQGPLRVEGSGSAVTFDFGGDIVFDGQVNAGNTYVFTGVFTYQGAEMDVYHLGDVSTRDGKTLLEGRFEIEVDDDDFDDNNCTLSSDMEAIEIVGED